MSRLVLGAIGGKEAQNKCSSSDFGKPESRLSLDRAEFYRKPIVAFLKEWLLSIDNQISNRDSLIYSAQTWQALGLVIHDLVESKVPEHRLTQAVRIIGELSYEKDSAFFKVVVIIRLVIKRLFFLDLDEPHQRVHSSLSCLTNALGVALLLPTTHPNDVLKSRYLYHCDALMA